jgi:hypothetical protein
MLMKGQYPCIPNWHCDNVPRNTDGKLEYGRIDFAEPAMLIWISGSPETTFLDKDIETPIPPRNHGELAEVVKHYIKRGDAKEVKLPANTWCQFRQNIPHRGNATPDYTWRVFARLTHKSIMTARPVISVVRRHAQVYLPHDFHW